MTTAAARTDAEAWQMVLDNERLISFAMNKARVPQSVWEDVYSELLPRMFRVCQMWDSEDGTLATYAVASLSTAAKRAMANTERMRLPYSMPLNMSRGYIKKRAGELVEQYKFDVETEWRQPWKLPREMETLIAARRNYEMKPVSNGTYWGGEAGEQVRWDTDPLYSVVDDAEEPYADSTDLLMLYSGMKRLPERQQIILEYRFGLKGKEEHTLREVAELLSLSHERIRQLERKAIQRLKETCKP